MLGCGMPMQLNCEQGHRWEADGTELRACPVCGGAGRVGQPETVILSPGGASTPDPQSTVWKELVSERVTFDSDPELKLPPEKAGERSRLDGLLASSVANRPTLPGYEILEELGRG